jgi:hypothetical protein
MNQILFTLVLVLLLAALILIESQIRVGRMVEACRQV